MRRVLNRPRPARVRTGAAGVPVAVDGRAVERVRESWLLEDRWWTEHPLRRRYWEVLTVDGRNRVLFRDLGAASSARTRAGVPAGAAGWFSQGA